MADNDDNPLDIPEKNSNKSSCILYSVSLFSLLVLLISVLSWYHFSRLQSFISESKAHISALQKELETSKLEIQHLHRHEQLIDQQLTQVQSRKKTPPSYWQAMRALDFLTFAEWQDTIGGDPSKILPLITHAHQLLQDNPNNTIQKINTRLASAIEQYSSQKITPVSDLIQTLQSLKKNIPTLSWKIASTQQQSTDTKTVRNGNTWKQYWYLAQEKISSFVIVRHDNPDTLISPWHARIIHDMLIMNIEMAQWGALLHNDLIFHQALINTLHTIQQYANVSESSVRTFIQSLESLKKISIAYSPWDSSIINDLSTLIDQEHPT